MTAASETSAATASSTTAVFRVYIKTTPEAIWQAITDPSWTVKYGYGGYANYDLRPGGAFTFAPDETMKAASEAMGWPLPAVIIDGEVLEADPPRRLRTTWRMLMDPTTASEGFSTLTHEIAQVSENYCSLTVTHECEGMPTLLAMVSGAGDAKPEEGGGGHPWILSDLKSLLETGTAMSR